MRAARSAGSTSAPHFVILSTSFDQAALVRRCWRMMRASWHSRQAVVALACIGPAGRSAVTLAPVVFWVWAEKGGAAASARAAKAAVSLAKLCGAVKSRALSKLERRLRRKLGNMDLHLIHGVVKITAGIPDWRGGLDASLAVGGARQQGVVAGLTRFPIVGPKTPGIVSLIVTQLCRNPCGSAVGRNLDLLNIGFSGPGGTVHADVASF